MGIAAFGAGTLYETVREEHVGLLVIELLTFLSDEIGLVIKLTEELGGVLCVNLRRSAGIDVKIDSQASEGVLHYLVVLVHNVLGSYSLVLGLDGDGHAVFI